MYDDSSDNFTCQYPSFISVTVKIFMLLSWLCISLAFNCLVELFRVKAYSHPAIALLSDDQVVNPAVGLSTLIIVTMPFFSRSLNVCFTWETHVLPGVRDLPVVLNHWRNAAVHLNVVRFLYSPIPVKTYP